MPLEPYQYQPVTSYNRTPSPRTSPRVPGSAHSRNTSNSSTWSSPDSALTRATSPSPSPKKHHGPILLPRVRPQDQTLEPHYDAGPTYRRARSSDPRSSPKSLSSRPQYQRSTTSPPESTPVSTAYTEVSWASSTTNPPVTFSSSYGRRNLGHTRSTSTSSIDPATLRHRFPAYRTLPVYITQAPQYTPATTPGLADFVSPALPAPYRKHSRHLTPEYIFESGREPTNSITKYLSGPNPTVALVPASSTNILGNGNAQHYWWDIRNLRPWEDFDLDTIMSIEGFSKLLNIEINAAALPIPTIDPSAYEPQSLIAVQDICARFHASKVNVALRTSQGPHRHMNMLPERSGENGPHFISNYADDVDKTQSGNGRGRVVGLVKPYERWNTGMRREKGQKLVEYLATLSQLQRLMREHSCRYSFIITEIELVCVRMGTEEGTPYFGFLELSRPITMHKQQGLTPCLALWYLHMLASDQPLDGQYGWKVNVGPRDAYTRSHILKPDDWIPTKITTSESRSAKRHRGWVFPTEPIHKKREV